MDDLTLAARQRVAIDYLLRRIVAYACDPGVRMASARCLADLLASDRRFVAELTAPGPREADDDRPYDFESVLGDGQ